ncbi:MAG: hypothetical protein ABGX04_12540 [Myxococcales bacterium]|nr:hypothetical protein [Myxococcales bacterium]
MQIAKSSFRLGTALTLLVALVWGSTASARMLTADETETLVRATYFEGMPEEEARRIGPAGAARLAEMLADSDESSIHGQIMLALGLCGSPDAMAAIQDWVGSPPEGEVDRDTFRAWQALPYALGHLARFDRRALRLLETLMNAGPPSWTFRQHRGPRLSRLTRESAVSSLAETGLPEAGRILKHIPRDATDVQFGRHLQEARAKHRERAAEESRR